MLIYSVLPTPSPASGGDERGSRLVRSSYGSMELARLSA
jgi:hypothetical protein